MTTSAVTMCFEPNHRLLPTSLGCRVAGAEKKLGGKARGLMLPRVKSLDLQLYCLVDRAETNRLVTCMKGNQKSSSFHDAQC